MMSVPDLGMKTLAGFDGENSAGPAMCAIVPPPRCGVKQGFRVSTQGHGPGTSEQRHQTFSCGRVCSWRKMSPFTLIAIGGPGKGLTCICGGDEVTSAVFNYTTGPKRHHVLGTAVATSLLQYRRSVAKRRDHHQSRGEHHQDSQPESVVIHLFMFLNTRLPIHNATIMSANIRRPDM
jgi:hypothetical protein